MGSFLRKRVYCALLLRDHIHFRSFLLFHYAILYARIAITIDAQARQYSLRATRTIEVPTQSQARRCHTLVA